MPDEERTLTRAEVERYIISERLPGQYSAADGGRAARFRLAQDGVAAVLSRTAEPEKRAELAGTLNSLRAFSGEFAKCAENRAMYESARQIYEDYLASPESYGGSMLIPAVVNGERTRINAVDLADIAYVSERRLQELVSGRRRAAEQEFGSDRIVNGVDFYGLTSPECADALLGYAENAATGKPPETAAQEAFAALNRRLAEKRAEREMSREVPEPERQAHSEPESAERTQTGEQQPDIREQLDRAIERIAALEEQNKRLSERNRRLEGMERTVQPQRAERVESSERETTQPGLTKQNVARERISFKQLLAEAGTKSTLTTKDSFTPEISAEKQKQSL